MPISIEDVIANRDFYRVKQGEKVGFFANHQRIELERLVYGSYLLRREQFLLRGRTNRIGEGWLAENAPAFADYSQTIESKFLHVRIPYLVQEVEYLRSAVKLQARIERKKLRQRGNPESGKS